MRYLTAILLLSALLRLPYLADYPSVWHHDHMAYGAEARAFTWTGITERRYSIGMPFLGFSKAAFAIFGEHLWVIRLPAALAGLASVALLYLLGRDLFDTQVGLFAAALASTQHVLLLYSRLPAIGEPVPFTLLAVWLALRAWDQRAYWCASGALAGFALWAIWEALVTVPMLAAGFAVLRLARPRAWRGLCWWLLGFVLLSPLSHPSAVLNLIEALGNRAHPVHWTLREWAFQVQHGLGTLVYYPDAGGWGRWDAGGMLLPLDVVFLSIGLLLPWTLATLLCWACVLAVGLFGGVLIIDPANWYHLIYAMPFLVLLVARTYAALPPFVAVPIALLTMALNLATLWPGVAYTLPHPAVVAARVIADHRSARCIGLIDTPDDQPFPQAPLYAFVADAPVWRGVTDCPITIVLPSVKVPFLCQEIPSRDGPVRVCGDTTL